MATKYSKEFKEDALRLAAKEGVAATSEKLGIVKRSIYDWRRFLLFCTTLSFEALTY